MGMFTRAGEGWRSLLIFFSKNHSAGASSLFVLFLEVAEPAIRQSGIKKKPILSLAHVSG